MKKPVAVIAHIIWQAEQKLEAIHQDKADGLHYYILCGAIGSGKTEMMIKLADRLKALDITVGGIVSPRVLDDDQTIGYDVMDLKKNHRIKFLRKGIIPKSEKIGQYSIDPEGLKIGRAAILDSIRRHDQVTFIDEVGKLEFDGKGWHEVLRVALSNPKRILVLAIRDEFVEEAIAIWDLDPVQVFNVSENHLDSIVASISQIQFQDSSEIN